MASISTTFKYSYYFITAAVAVQFWRSVPSALVPWPLAHDIRTFYHRHSDTTPRNRGRPQFAFGQYLLIEFLKTKRCHGVFRRPSSQPSTSVQRKTRQTWKTELEQIAFASEQGRNHKRDVSMPYSQKAEVQRPHLAPPVVAPGLITLCSGCRTTPGIQGGVRCR